MKIHIVQKGDTLWKLAQKYGVDFEEMKQMNNHLADPDMLMPGMKVKVPSNAVQAKKEMPKKEEMLKKSAPKELPKKEMKKAEPIMDTPKKGLPKKELPKIGDILDDLKPLVKELLQEMKPEIINQIKIDLQMTQVNETKKYPIQEVKPFQPTPPPAPKVQMMPAPKVQMMPAPYMPEEKPKAPPMEHPCPPYPSHTMGQMPGYNSGYGMGSMMHQAPSQPQPYQAAMQPWHTQQQAPSAPWQHQVWQQQAPYPSSMMPGANQGTYGMSMGHHPAHTYPHYQHATPRLNEEDTEETRVN